jgi:hypothetical protein
MRFVVGNEFVDEPNANAWFDELELLEREGAYFFCSTPVITEVLKIT